MKLLNPLRRNRCHLCCVDFSYSLSFWLLPQYRGIFHIFTYRLCPQIQVVAVVEDVSCSYCMAYSGERMSIVPFCRCSHRRFNGLVLLVIGGRSNECLLCLSHGLAVLGATAQWLRCIVRLCRSFLGFQVLPLELHIALEIYVVPFSNAKVGGSFRMARLNMFRRKEVA